MKPIIFFIVGFLLASFIAVSMEPVSIQGQRFYSGGQPYFPTTHFLTVIGESSLKYLSHKMTDADRLKVMNNIVAGGYNTIYHYLINEDLRLVTPYLDLKRVIGGAFDEAKIQGWRAKFEGEIAQGLRPILWLFPDDSKKVKVAPIAELKRYMEKMVASFDDLPIMWVLGLEIDEYWSKSQSDELGAHLKLLTARPIGVHQKSGHTDYMTSSWVDFGAYQHGFNGAWPDIYQAALNAQQAIGNKPLLFAEYQKLQSFTANQEGLASAFAGSAGVGNGAPIGLADFMAGLPDGMVPSRDGNILTLSGNGVVAHADMATLQFFRE